jgi:cellulose synthase/poly-beta-1,6-N-acetylglucosamine synthase-like glycosyltransferase
MAKTPSTTIILPVRNESRHIRETLRAVLNQDYPRQKMEVIVADGASTDDTSQIVAELARENENLRLVHNPERIVPTGFNRALQEARGEIIIRVDGHTRVAGDYVRQCVDALQRTPAVTVGGRMDPVGETPIGKAIALATTTPFGVGGSRFHFSTREEWVDTVYMGAWRRETFRQIGGLDEEMVRNQDDEFNYRIRANGGGVLLSPAIHSVYTVRPSLSALWRQYFQYGFWKVRVLQKHPRQMQMRQFLPALFVLALLASFLLMILTPERWPLPVGIAGVYVLANTAASVLAVLQRRKGPGMAGLVFLVNATMHIGYGTGFILGLLFFINRWKDREGKVAPV